MRYKLLLFPIIITALVYSCNPRTGDKGGAEQVVPQTEDDTGPEENTTTERKYGVKSGEIVYETSLNTISVHMTYKTVVYFDDYGIKERRDTYKGDTLTESYLSDGKNTYRINHEKKQAFFSGKAYKGTEPKFGWNGIGEEDKKSGKAKLAPDEIIAGKECTVYTVKSDIVSAKFAGWEDIVMLSEISSPGGVSSTVATSITIEKVPASTFRIPRGYKVS